MTDLHYSKQHVRELLAERMKELEAVREDGQKEYAHSEDRPFRNFEALTEELGIPREAVCWVYLKKHLDGVLAYLNGHRSQREPVKGRFKDLHMYLYLLEFMLQEDEENRLRAEGNMLENHLRAARLHDTDRPGIAG